MQRAKVDRMSEHRWSWTTRTSLPSRHGAYVPCMQEILEQAAQSRLGRTRPVRHRADARRIAHQRDPARQCMDESKQVQVECKVSPERFWLRVEDEGPGFRPRCRARLHRRRKSGMSRRPRPGADPGVHDATSNTTSAAIASRWRKSGRPTPSTSAAAALAKQAESTAK